MAEQSAAVAPETVAGLTGAQVVDLVESWLRAEPDLRYGKARAQGLTGHSLEVTRRQFTEARARIGLTARVAPRADHPIPETGGVKARNGAGQAVAGAAPRGFETARASTAPATAAEPGRPDQPRGDA